MKKGGGEPCSIAWQLSRRWPSLAVLLQARRFGESGGVGQHKRTGRSYRRGSDAPDVARRPLGPGPTSIASSSAKLEAAGIAPVRDAGPRTLLRRIYFDLVELGLPPSPRGAEFAADPSPGRFAERWSIAFSRHPNSASGGLVIRSTLFDLPSGRPEFNFTYPHAWPYRDYVIDAFNPDKPFDRFLIEQLAGDLLPTDDAPYDNATAVATGFLAIGPKRHNTGGARLLAKSSTIRSM